MMGDNGSSWCALTLEEQTALFRNNVIYIKKGARFPGRPFLTTIVAVVLVHAAHAAGAAWTPAGRSRLLIVFLQLGDERFRREHQAGD
jgi:hypothetical protein